MEDISLELLKTAEFERSVERNRERAIASAAAVGLVVVGLLAVLFRQGAFNSSVAYSTAVVATFLSAGAVVGLMGAVITRRVLAEERRKTTAEIIRQWVLWADDTDQYTTEESARRAQQRLSEAVAAARASAEAKLAEAEQTALEWVRAADADAKRAESLRERIYEVEHRLSEEADDAATEHEENPRV